MKAVSAEEAIAMIPNGASITVSGFMGVGTPERLLDELVRQQKSGLSIICNDAAVPGKGVHTRRAAGGTSNPRLHNLLLFPYLAVDHRRVCRVRNVR